MYRGRRSPAHLRASTTSLGHFVLVLLLHRDSARRWRNESPRSLSAPTAFATTGLQFFPGGSSTGAGRRQVAILRNRFSRKHDGRITCGAGRLSARHGSQAAGSACTGSAGVSTDSLRGSVRCGRSSRPPRRPPRRRRPRQRRAPSPRRDSSPGAASPRRFTLRLRNRPRRGLRPLQ